MLVRALKTFRGRYGLIRTGNEFECEPGYFRQLERNRMAERIEARTIASQERTPPGPADNKSVPAAPVVAGKTAPGGQGKPPGTDTAPPQAGGKAVTSRSLRADLASRAKTSKASGAGGSVKVTTPAAVVSAESPAGTDPQSPTPASGEDANGGA